MQSVLVFVGVCSVCSAIQLPSYFASSMVLQYGKPITFWGMVEPGAAVTVNFGTTSSLCCCLILDALLTLVHARARFTSLLHTIPLPFPLLSFPV